MEEDFQIEEMVHQDSEGVVFQAKDLRNQSWVSVRRFFLSEEASKKLQETGEDGVTLFESGLEWLKAQEISGLRRVIAGGLDQLDETPYLVSEWVEGKTVHECAENGELAGGEGPVFESLVRTVLLALPEAQRESVRLDAKGILLTRGEQGELQVSVTLSPRRYFGAMGGMHFPTVDRQRALSDLKALFPPADGLGLTSARKGAQSATATSAMKRSTSGTTTQLASASKGSGTGLLWVSGVAVVAVLGVAGWLLMTQSKGSAESEPEVAAATAPKEAQEREAPAEGENLEDTGEEAEASEPVVELAETDGDVEVAEGLEKELELAEEPAEILVAEGVEPEPSGASEEEPTPEPLVKAEMGEGFTVVEEKASRELNPDDLFGADPVETPEPRAAASAGQSWQPNTFLEKGVGTFVTQELRSVIESSKGEDLTLTGVVSRVDQSRSGKHWYLFFEGDDGEELRVIYRHGDDAGRGTFEELEAFLGQTLQLKGKSVSFAGSVEIRASNWSEISRSYGPRVFQLSEVAEVSSFVPAEVEVEVEGTLIGFATAGQFGYLLFEEDSTVRGRFALAGELGSNAAFKRGLGAMKGKKVSLRGLLREDSSANVDYVIELEAPDSARAISD